MRKESVKPQRVAIVAAPGLSLFEFAAAQQVLAEVNELPGPARYEVLICGPATEVTVEGGLRLSVPHRLSRLRTVGTVIVAPLVGATPAPDLLAELRRAHRRGARLVSLCTGALVLAAAGLLTGRRATTHWLDASTLAGYPGVTVDPDVLYIDDGDVLTSAGSAASLDLCLHLVRVDHGADVAAQVARRLVVPPHRDGGQAQYIAAPTPAEPTDLFTAALDWAQHHLAEPVQLADLAHRSAMSPRTFARRFAEHTQTTPYQWLLRQRLLRAQQLLETTELTVDAIADESGLGSAANLRAHFARVLHTSPHRYRSTFRGRALA